MWGRGGGEETGCGRETQIYRETREREEHFALQVRHHLSFSHSSLAFSHTRPAPPVSLRRPTPTPTVFLTQLIPAVCLTAHNGPVTTCTRYGQRRLAPLGRLQAPSAHSGAHRLAAGPPLWPRTRAEIKSEVVITERWQRRDAAPPSSPPSPSPRPPPPPASLPGRRRPRGPTRRQTINAIPSACHRYEAHCTQPRGVRLMRTAGGWFGDPRVSEA